MSPWFAAPHPPQQYAEGPVSYDPEAPYDEWYEEQAQQQGYGQQGYEPQGYDEQLAYEQQQYADQQAYDQQRYAQAQRYAQDQQHAQDRRYAEGQRYAEGGPQPEQGHEASEVADDGAGFRVPAGPGRTRPLANGHLIPGPREEQAPAPEPEAEPLPEPAAAESSGLPDDMTREEAYFTAFRKYVSEMGDYPNARQFSLYLMDLYGVTGQSGGPLTESTLRPYLRGFRDRYQRSLDENAADAEHIA
ncbi:hypothetical protein STRAU_2096 [Streptomyces aurantiacus JA 4570]|uniref:Uncharacterized protein n=1 Tax=Streptomyces aurantiacus JA 4570 TaxID=1286094 RepID=S3ZMN7_9ACTN|nr:hypothetical protein STRAU_2096 [Streptomyces aurantiacus JA 4570]